jgi:hypothetical protein
MTPFWSSWNGFLRIDGVAGKADTIGAHRMERLPVQVLIPEPVVGWLLVLCLLLTFALPAMVLHAVGADSVPALLHSHSVKSKILCGIYTVLFTGIAVFSFIAGVRLWMVKPGAVRLAKRFLLTFLLIHVGYFVFWFLLRRPIGSSVLAEMGWYHVGGPFLPFYLWTVYLESSKRVRETYPEG